MVKGAGHAVTRRGSHTGPPVRRATIDPAKTGRL